MSDHTTIAEDVLSTWAGAIREHQPERVAALFTEDAVFQGFDPRHTVGRSGVAAYYDKQPVGLDPRYRVQEVRPFGEHAFLAFVDVDFVRPSGEVIPTHLTLAFVQGDDAWRIRQYHVSKIDA